MTNKTEAEHHRDVLMEANHKTAIDIGLCNKNVAVAGPHLLMFCEDFTSIINDQAAKISALEMQLVDMENELNG